MIDEAAADRSSFGGALIALLHLAVGVSVPY